MTLAGRVALVTGGMGGIGTAICRRLAQSGLRVAAGCPRGYPKRDEWLAAMRAEGFDIQAAEGNVDEFESCVDMISGVRAGLGEVDVLVNNAGITRDGLLRRMSAQDWMAVINTNLNSVFNVSRQVVESMGSRGWGRIVNISSVNALRGQFGQTNYSAAKAGMHGFSKALAQELVAKGVTVNTISPGYVATDMVKAMPPQVLEQVTREIPMGRLARPEEIAGLVNYLVSEEAAYITGANITINGGLYMA